MNANASAALSLLLVVLLVDAWIFTKARTREAEGREVIAVVGPVTLSNPAQWLVGCLLLWIVVVPAYLVARNA